MECSFLLIYKWPIGGTLPLKREETSIWDIGTIDVNAVNDLAAKDGQFFLGVSFHSSQGFQLGEHGLWGKRMFYEQNVCVHCVFSCPGILPAGKVIDEPVEIIDFVPTHMDLTGLDMPNSIRGRNLMPLIRGDVTDWNEAFFCEMDHSMSMYNELRNGTERRVMIRANEWEI